MYSGQFFRVKCIVKGVVEVGRHVFSCQSLLLSTIVHAYYDIIEINFVNGTDQRF